MCSYARFVVSVTAAIFLCSAPLAHAQSLSSQDRNFIRDAAEGGRHEVNTGNLEFEDTARLSRRLILRSACRS
jgi:hypothetical protein